ncbi:DUF4082 domain-containing protein [Paractinoplanes hotanensis]|uniref:DUF4082 domain-containing protein n=1 Tax=Paractinoplanes hotanensis TaxID=2906497 RepID=A0ABT0YFN2_9ACTN|nr:DUF4082 domain-containing protein [Actinoplanes hotanensis]MCM4084863.1 DUF4082 domain-containing protein [Actinoplanes hotanensis]
MRRRPLLLALCLVLVATFLTAPQAAAAAVCPCSIWPSTAVPANPAEPDTAAVEVGVKFRSDNNGFVTAVRFYKGSGNTGTHVGHLWSAAGVNLGAATFTNETATGWQTATFAAPVAIAAGTTYVASYYAPNGRYAADDNTFATAGVDNEPLHALRNGVDGGNGVYRYGAGGGFPANTWMSANYWVDVVFTDNGVDTTAPSVSGSNPPSGATGVPTTTTVSATFSEALQAGSAALAVGGVAGASSYDAPSRTITFTPSSPLAASTSYTATVTGARDAAGNTMVPYTWNFTTAAPGGACPCTIWPPTATPATAAVADNSAVELGVRFRTSTAGFITGLRFYKGSGNTGTHTGGLWTNTGARLSTVTFTGESATGWQTATLPSPVAVTANTTYVASYHTDTGFYSATANGLAAAVSRGPLTAPANAANSGNGLYRYGASAFPTGAYQATNYWVDVVFNTVATDTTPPVLSARSPGAGATGVATTARVTATFSEPVTGAAVALTGVAGATTYDAGTSTLTFTPSAALAHSSEYTATVSGARDAAGNLMAPATWSFSTAAPPPPPPDQGPGGPILVVKPSGAGFTPFLAEVLRTEGLNEFTTAELPAVTAATLSQYDVVLLGSTALTAAQVAMFTTWVSGGGNLVAFRPDKQLAGLLGLTSTTGTLAEGYLKVDTTAAPGAGITDQTIQFHGVADRWTPAGARLVATLYSNATTATTNPAVTLADVGTAGGQAAAFTFDLSQSLVQTRQGNPAWDGQDRDGSGPIRSDDLYFGGSSADWVNLAKVAVPQADEQQRLLANLIGVMNLDRKPLPKFWYFPRSLKAVVVGTGDDHATGGTAGRFNQYAANSVAGCDVATWQCNRFTSYVFPDTPLSNSQAAAYQAQGFEVGLHVSTGCSNYTATSIASTLTSQLTTWRTKYSSLAAPATNRTHCIVWSDWSSQASAEAATGIRLDTNYYYWPGSWVADRPGFMTGSGMPMRFSAKTGGLLDIYQAATQMTDESGQSYPFTVDTLLDRALGAEGYYGAFTANMHTDLTTTYDSDQVLESARSRGVPVVSAAQLLTWLDGRNASSYSGISWSGTTLSFTVNVGAGATGLTGMVPTVGTGGRALTTLTRAGTAVPFTRTTIKGVEYAMFTAAPGAYAAEYGAVAAARKAPVAPARSAPDSQAPSASALSILPWADGTARISWSTGESAAATVLVGANPAELDAWPADLTGRQHRAVVTGLQPGTTYHYRVRSTDPAGNVTVWPAPGRPPATFVSSAAGVADHTAAQWRTGAENQVVVTSEGVRPSGRSGTLVSRVLDAGQMVTWDRLKYEASAPAGASVVVQVRTGSTSAPGASWSGWRAVRPDDRVTGSSRYAQYRVELRAGRDGAGPVFRGLSITSDAKPLRTPTETGR